MHFALKPLNSGIVVRYQCDEMYNGTPTASCGDDGMYMVSGMRRVWRHGGVPLLGAMPWCDAIAGVPLPNAITGCHSWMPRWDANDFQSFPVCYPNIGRCRRECGPPPKVDHAAPR